MDTKLSPQAPLIVRLLAWANERFPLANAILFFVLYAAALFLGRLTTTAGEVNVRASDFLGFLAIWAFFLMLRVFDEHKDYDLDLLNHPDRVLQSGLVTLGHLKVLGGLAILLQLLVSLYLANGTGLILVFWLICFGWSLLMAVEFFCGEWLEKRLVLYAFSHMIVMPMALVWMAQIGAGDAALPAPILWLAGLSFLSGAAFEVTRKMKAPEDERETIDSYTKVFGTQRAPLVVMFLLISGSVFLGILIQTITPNSPFAPWMAALVASLLPALVALNQFKTSASAQSAKRCEGFVALTMLTGYAMLISAAIVERGVAWV